MPNQPIPLATADRKRTLSKEADVILRNRFVESDPVLTTDDQPAYIARPALKWWKRLGEGPIRGIFFQPGAFNDDAFIMSFNTLYRSKRDTTDAVLAVDFFGGEAGTRVSMTCTGDIGDISPHLFIADGQTLRVYTERGPARGVLVATVNPANNDVVRLGDTYYKITTGAVDTGTPDGTVANPWLVARGLTIIATYTTLYKAINSSGDPGVDYSTDLLENDVAVAWQAVSTGLYVRARIEGIAGNAIVTTETGANMSWGAGTLASGGTSFMSLVPMPNDVGVISVAFLNGYVIVIPAQGQGINGRFYWIEPGETVVDPVNFATAERSADPVYQCVVFSDQFWLPGQNTTEVWYFTGDIDVPVRRLQGVVFDRGTHPGTALQVKDSMVIIDANGGVFQIKGGEKRISTPDIEERIRKAIAYQHIKTPL